MKHQSEIVRNSMINLEDFVNLLARPKNLGIARDGKSVKNSTDTDFEPKHSTKMRISRHIAIRGKTAC